MRVSDAGAEELTGDRDQVHTEQSSSDLTGYKALLSVCVSLEHELQNGLLKPETAQNSGA